MPDIKKHYKIFIAILIVIILISSFIVYGITKNNVTYNNNGEHVDVKYYSNPCDISYTPEDYKVSSSYIDNNKVSYMNSTIINPCFHTPNLYSGLNIHLKNVNAKYIYLYFSGLSEYPFHSNIINGKLIKNTNNNDNYELKIKIESNNITINRISMMPLHTGSNHYIFIKIALNNNFYNLFDISSIKETTIYGEILNTQGQIYNVNTTLLIEDTNNSNYKTIHVISGYYYCFLKPDTEYKIYSAEKNNTLELITTTPANLTINKSFYYNIFDSEL